MRRSERIDRNQPEIVEALRKLGATVQLLHTDHDGIPDLLAGYQGRNFLLRVKDDRSVPLVLILFRLLKPLISPSYHAKNKSIRWSVKAYLQLI